MIVTFVSECSGRAIRETQKVLDAYAFRVGARTWQTVITQQGLDAVRMRLAKKARKNTAVACHRNQSRRQTELVWIVGNRRRFDRYGRVPVHRTLRDLIREDDENDWPYLPLLEILVEIAALFHDFGKAWRPFQKFLMANSRHDTQRDPWRHEWVSTLLFRAAVKDESPGSFAQMLMDLGEHVSLREKLSDKWIARAEQFAQKAYLLSCDTFGWKHWIEWLVLSHHRLPSRDPKSMQSGVRSCADIFSQTSVIDSYEKVNDGLNLSTHWVFEHGLPIVSEQWCLRAQSVGKRLKCWVDSNGIERLLGESDFIRPLLLLSRAALMIGDHEFSSKKKQRWDGNYQAVANTVPPSYLLAAGTESHRTAAPEARQFLDEHLVGVTEQASAIARLYPALERELAWIEQCRPLRKPSRGKFQWQNRCVSEIREWNERPEFLKMGFFGLNMASTGHGKTLANAKIMDALQGDRLRFSLALGLRTLTLQTGYQYQKHLNLHESELAVIVGSQATIKLNEDRQRELEAQSDWLGSASDEDLAGSVYVAFEDAIPDDKITTVIGNAKARQLLKAPILVCTIDHLISAVEGTRGNAQPLPLLRLLSSDLVIDEVDDFDPCDMPAIARLVHLVGMLGRRVLLSSATIAPAVAEGLFESYWMGWKHHASFRQADNGVLAFWADEFQSTLSPIAQSSAFSNRHATFVEKRIKKLHESDATKQKACVCRIVETCANTSEEHETNERLQSWHHSIANEIFRLHQLHAWHDPTSGKQISIGAVRVANVDPCIQLSEFLLTLELPNDTEIRVVCYHARQVLFLRNEIERNLDRMLARSEVEFPSNDPSIAHHIRRCNTKNLIFLVIATPIAEIGRDHDYDWAIIEPSSVRSIIQMAGRVRRHRDSYHCDFLSNVSVLDYNRRAFVERAIPAFKWPGFEAMDRTRADHIVLDNHQLSQLLDMDALSVRIDSTLRITENSNLCFPNSNLADLEHRVLRSVLTDQNTGAAFVNGWLNNGYWLTDAAQRASRFRQSISQSDYRLIVDEDDHVTFRVHDTDRQRNQAKQPPVAHNIAISTLAPGSRPRIWLNSDYLQLVESYAEKKGCSKLRVCEDFGGISLAGEFGEVNYSWTAELGALKQSRK